MRTLSDNSGEHIVRRSFAVRPRIEAPAACRSGQFACELSPQIEFVRRGVAQPTARPRVTNRPKNTPGQNAENPERQPYLSHLDKPPARHFRALSREPSARSRASGAGILSPIHPTSSIDAYHARPPLATTAASPTHPLKMTYPYPDRRHIPAPGSACRFRRRMSVGSTNQSGAVPIAGQESIDDVAITREQLMAADLAIELECTGFD
jgi:hypothetical protein